MESQTQKVILVLVQTLSWSLKQALQGGSAVASHRFHPLYAAWTKESYTLKSQSYTVYCIYVSDAVSQIHLTWWRLEDSTGDSLVPSQWGFFFFFLSIMAQELECSNVLVQISLMFDGRGFSLRLSLPQLRHAGTAGHQPSHSRVKMRRCCQMWLFWLQPIRTQTSRVCLCALYFLTLLLKMKPLLCSR